MTSPAPSLPCPSKRPEADVVIYDGDCGICSAQVRKLPWWDCRQKLSYISLHDAQVAKRWPQLPAGRLMQEMCIVTPSGHEYWGIDAIRHLTRRLRRLWWLAPLLHVPGSMFVWRPLYRWIARNRYRLSGMKDCPTNVCTTKGRANDASQTDGYEADAGKLHR
ncbi:MAG: DUF393 domain-containing protein [Pirellulales bacterium]|nr:DUF393 domain-containing protein [Pirellulales bacterium]